MVINYMKLKQQNSLALILGVGTLFFTQPVLADTTVVYKQTSGTQTSSNTMQIKDGKIRFSPPDQSNSYSLYDSTTGTITHVDSSRKHYLSMTEENMMGQANQARLQMEVMRQRMIEKMKDMPPEQRKQVEQMMNNHLSRVGKETATPKIDQKKTSRIENIKGIQCTIYESYINEIKTSEVCMTEADKLGISDQDSKALMSMQAYMKRMQNAVGGNNIPMAELKGIPLHTRLFAADGSVKMETRLEKLSTDNISSMQMSIPADFSLMQMPKAPGM